MFWIADKRSKVKETEPTALRAITEDLENAKAPIGQRCNIRSGC